MMRKMSVCILCVLLVLIATSSGVSADEFSHSHCNITPEGELHPAVDLVHDSAPQWVWDESAEEWYIDWSIQTHGALNIDASWVIVDLCDLAMTRDFKCELELEVDKNNGQQIWTEFSRNPGWNNPDTCDGTHIGVNTYEDSTATIQVGNLAQGDEFVVTVTFTVWDCNEVPPDVYDNSEWGIIYIGP